jgi:hypothetical protein
MYVRAKANVIIVLWRPIQGENLIFFVLVFFALLHVLLVIKDIFYVMCIYSYDAYHQLQVPYFKKRQLLINVNSYSFLCATVYCLILIFLFHFEVFITVFRISHTLTHSSYHLPIAIYLIVLIHLIIKEIDIDPNNASDNRGHGGF